MISDPWSENNIKGSFKLFFMDSKSSIRLNILPKVKNQSLIYVFWYAIWIRWTIEIGIPSATKIIDTKTVWLNLFESILKFKLKRLRKSLKFNNNKLTTIKIKDEINKNKKTELTNSTILSCFC